MEHGKKNRKFGLETKQRKALMRSLAVSLITNGKIKTTEAKAKSLRTFIEKLISRGKRSDLATVRYLGSVLDSKSAAKIIKDIAPKFVDRRGGYTRITKLGERIADSAQMAYIEFIQ